MRCNPRKPQRTTFLARPPAKSGAALPNSFCKGWNTVLTRTVSGSKGRWRIPGLNVPAAYEDLKALKQV